MFLRTKVRHEQEAIAKMIDLDIVYIYKGLVNDGGETLVEFEVSDYVPISAVSKLKHIGQISYEKIADE